MGADDRRSAFRARARAMSMSMTLANYSQPKAEAVLNREVTNYVPHRFRVPISAICPIDMDPMMSGDDAYFLMDDKYDAVWPINATFAMPHKSERRGDFTINSFRTVQPKEFRGLAQRFSSKMIFARHVAFVGGRWSDGHALLSYLGGEWVDAMPRGICGPLYGEKPSHFKAEMNMQVQSAIGLALRQRYDWHAIFEFPNGISLRFATSAEAALAIFRDRDKPAELQRRNPLLHWVRRHWRHGRTTPELLREVRKHLRGKSTFRWHDMDVTILPSEYELETAA